MLQDNSFPDEKSRRWVIAKLLSIPPAFMGVESLDDLLRSYEQTKIVAPTPKLNPSYPFDHEEYRIALKDFWEHHHRDAGSINHAEIALRTSVLEHELLYEEKDRDQKKKIAALLCGHHMLCSTIATDQQDFDTAIVHLNYAYTVAKERRFIQLQGGILLRRGWVLNERGEAYALHNQLDLAQADFQRAKKDFDIGLTLSKKLPASMQGSLLLSQGRLAAWQATRPDALHRAIVKLDEAYPFTGKKSKEADIHFINLSEERYHRVRAAAYLASTNPLACYPREARKELRNANLVALKACTKRQEVYTTILESKSYVIEGQALLTRKKRGQADDCFSKATKKANEAIMTASKIVSKANITRIERIWQDLQATPFAENNADLGYLEVQIFTAKHPYMFA